MSIHRLCVSIRKDKKKIDENDRAHLVKDVELMDQLLFERLVVDQVSDH